MSTEKPDPSTSHILGDWQSQLNSENRTQSQYGSTTIPRGVRISVMGSPHGRTAGLLNNVIIKIGASPPGWLSRGLQETKSSTFLSTGRTNFIRRARPEHQPHPVRHTHATCLYMHIVVIWLPCAVGKKPDPSTSHILGDSPPQLNSENITQKSTILNFCGRAQAAVSVWFHHASDRYSNLCEGQPMCMRCRVIKQGDY